MSDIVEIRSLSKQFGRRRAVDQLDLTVGQGEIFGLVGPNGAGKTTTLLMLVTLLRPDHGEIKVSGFSVAREPRAVRAVIGFIPDVFGLYGNLTVAEYLDFFGACYGIASEQRRRLIGELLELVSISHRREDMVDTLSRGLQQRLALARVLMHDPQVLVLDEPASGLDPRARVEIRQLLIEIAKRGKTIIFSSHVLADVAELCSRVGILEQGRLVACGTLDQLNRQAVPHRFVRIELMQGANASDSQQLLASVPAVSHIRLKKEEAGANRIIFEVEFQGNEAALNQMLVRLLEKGLPIVHFGEVAQTLEDVFMQSTQGIVS